MDNPRVWDFGTACVQSALYLPHRANISRGQARHKNSQAVTGVETARGDGTKGFIVVHGFCVYYGDSIIGAFFAAIRKEGPAKKPQGAKSRSIVRFPTDGKSRHKRQARRNLHSDFAGSRSRSFCVFPFWSASRSQCRFCCGVANRPKKQRS